VGTISFDVPTLSAYGFTASTAVPLTVPNVALMVVVPSPVGVAIPVASIIATSISDDVHVTCPIRFSVVPSLNVPVALNCSVAPKAIAGLEGVIVIKLRVASVTVTCATATSPENAAVMVVVPGASPVTTPAAVEPLPTVAAAVFEEVHVTEFVRF